MTQQETAPENLIKRERLLHLLQAGLWTETYRFARQLALAWLSSYPGDLEVTRWMAAVLAAEGKTAQSINLLEKILQTDPEDVESLAALDALCENQSEKSFEIKKRLYALGSGNVDQPDEWIKFLHNRHSEAVPATQATYLEILKYLSQAVNEPLLAIEHIKLTRQTQDAQSVLTLAQLYQKRFPEVLVLRIAAAEALLLLGQDAIAVNLLHHCSSQDSVGQVAGRWWGGNNPYQALWPGEMCIVNTIPIPGDVRYWLGENWLPGGSNVTSAEEPTDDSEINAGRNEKLDHAEVVSESNGNITITDIPDEYLAAQDNRKLCTEPSKIEKAFARIARQMKQSEVGNSDGRYPIYVIFTSKEGLTKKYGSATINVIDQEIQRLVKAVKARTDWGAVVFMPDDADCMDEFGLTPVNPSDPWKLKLSLTDLDKSLAGKGQRVGAVLIVGGADVVPFHHLPNPVDDVDQEVLSDNPYSTADVNYFIPEWPVGRMVGEDGSDAGLLLLQLRKAVKYHQDAARKIQEEKRSNGYLFNFWRLVFRRVVSEKQPTSNLGYTASVWKRASVAVYRPVSTNNRLLISPPVTTSSIEGSRVLDSRLGYFNLHGLEDAPDWYGQRDASDPSGEDYPIALKPKDLAKNGKAPQIVYSEACYGGFVVGKKETTSIALRFLSIGTLAVVGSTCVSYGSIGLPLIGADLLGNLFWRYVKEGYTVGDALLHSKIGLAREMTGRQGFLDGEDQKTLISFVLYGDPLLSYDIYNRESKRVLRSKKVYAIKTICDRGSETINQDIPRTMSKHDENMIKQVKAVVAPYLPGIDSVNIQIKQPHLHCDGKDHCCPTSQLKSKPDEQPVHQSVVIISKKIEMAHRVHNAYVRVTLDDEGKVVKMAFSR